MYAVLKNIVGFVVLTEISLEKIQLTLIKIRFGLVVLYGI